MSLISKVKPKTIIHFNFWRNIISILLLCLFFISSNSYANEEMKTNYSLQFNSNGAFCLAKINNILVMNSGKSINGDFFSGQTVSGLLENGTNTITVSMLNQPWGIPEGKPTQNMWCSITLNKLLSSGDLVSVAKAKLIVDKEGNIMNDSAFDSTPVIKFGRSNRRFEDDIIEVTKNVEINELPAWNWTKSTPITEHDIPKIQAFYEELQSAFARKDLKKIRMMTQGAWEMLATTRGGDADIMWDSMDFKYFFDEGYKAKFIIWDEYEFHTYKDGRLFRYEIGYSRVSPIRIENSDGSSFNYNPYLSIIDGKVTVVH